MNTRPLVPLSPQEFVDRTTMSRRQWTIVLLGLMMMIGEGLDATIATFVYPRIVKDWDTDLDAVTAAVTLGVLAMVIGGVAIGPLADRLGRRVIITSGIAVFGLGTAAMGLTQGVATLTVCRVVACLGLGAVLPSVIALVADWMPAARRGQMVALAFAGVTAGTMLGGALSAVMLPLAGWRVLLWVAGILPMLLIPAVLRFVPESLSVLATRPDAAKQVRAALTSVAPGEDLSGVDLDHRPAEPGQGQPSAGKRRRPALRGIMSGELTSVTLLLWLCCFMSVGVVFLLISYLPLITEDMGMTASQGGVLVALLGWGGLMGQLALSWAFKRFDRFRVVIALWVAGGTALVTSSLWAEHFAALLPTAFVLGFFLSGSGSAVQVIAADVYPPAARATGVSWASSMGKLGPVGFGLLGGLMVKVGWSLGTVFVVLVVPVGICIVAGLRLRAQRAARSAPVPEPLPVTSRAAETS